MVSASDIKYSSIKAGTSAKLPSRWPAKTFLYRACAKGSRYTCKGGKPGQKCFSPVNRSLLWKCRAYWAGPIFTGALGSWKQK